MIDLLQVAVRTSSFKIAFIGAATMVIGAYFFGRLQEGYKHLEHNFLFYFLDRKNKVKGPKNILALMDYPADTQIWNESQQKWMKISETPNYDELKKMRRNQLLANGLCVIGFTGVIIGLFIWPLCS